MRVSTMVLYDSHEVDVAVKNWFLDFLSC